MKNIIIEKIAIFISFLLSSSKVWNFFLPIDFFIEIPVNVATDKSKQKNEIYFKILYIFTLKFLTYLQHI